MDGLTPSQSAAQEAWEEAGVVGKAVDRCLGLYSYNKVLDPVGNFPCVALVYPIRVKTLLNDFPEKKQRRRKWFSTEEGGGACERAGTGTDSAGFRPAPPAIGTPNPLILAG